MSLADQLATESRPKPGHPCLTCLLFEGLDPSEVAEINEAWHDRRVTNVAVWDYVQEAHGADYSWSAFRNHYATKHDVA